MRKSRYFHGEADILLVPEEAVILWQLDLSMSPSLWEGRRIRLRIGRGGFKNLASGPSKLK